MTKLNKFKSAAAGGSGFKSTKGQDAGKVNKNGNFKKDRDHNKNLDSKNKPVQGARGVGLPNLANIKKSMVESLERKNKLHGTGFAEHYEKLKTQTFQ